MLLLSILAIAQTTTTMLPMRDGTKLATDVYLPAGKGPFPTVLARTPYNKDFAKGLGPQYTSRGYVFVAQDSRGRFKSEGANMAYDTDGWSEGLGDGPDTIAWIRKQPWSNGKIGTWGGSALGITQYLLVGASPAGLMSQHITVGSPSFYGQIAYQGGAFKKAQIEVWLSGQKFDEKQLKVWLDHPDYDNYWRERDLASRWSHADTPALHVGGWFDIFTQGTIDGFMGYQYQGGTHARGKQKMIIGPWPHAVNTRKAGAWTFPENATTPPVSFNDTFTWFDATLNGLDNGVFKEPAVCYYVMGDVHDTSAPGNVWRTSDVWPPPSTATKWFLHEDRTLGPAVPDDKVKPLEFAYNPADPVPTVGGNHLNVPSGPLDQSPIEGRPDVLLFTSEPLAKPLEVTGRVTAKLFVSSDCPDTDFTAKLCDVGPDGKSFNLCDGILRVRYRKSMSKPEMLKPGQVVPIEVDLWSTSYIFNKGHRLRLQVSSSCFPAYDPNPNTGERLRASDRTRVAHNRVWVDRGHRSVLVLPVVVGEQ